jgi:hypothetical protein
MGQRQRKKIEIREGIFGPASASDSGPALRPQHAPIYENLGRQVLSKEFAVNGRQARGLQ